MNIVNVKCTCGQCMICDTDLMYCHNHKQSTVTANSAQPSPEDKEEERRRFNKLHEPDALFADPSQQSEAEKSKEFILGELTGDDPYGLFSEGDMKLIFKAMQSFADQEVRKALQEQDAEILRLRGLLSVPAISRYHQLLQENKELKEQTELRWPIKDQITEAGKQFILKNIGVYDPVGKEIYAWNSAIVWLKQSINQM